MGKRSGGSLLRVADDAGMLAAFGFLGGELPLSIQRANSVDTCVDYDADGRVERIAHDGGTTHCFVPGLHAVPMTEVVPGQAQTLVKSTVNSHIHQVFEYDRDDAGNPLQTTYADSGWRHANSVEDYTYDAHGRLTSMDRVGGEMELFLNPEPEYSDEVWGWKRFHAGPQDRAWTLDAQNNWVKLDATGDTTLEQEYVEDRDHTEGGVLVEILQDGTLESQPGIFHNITTKVHFTYDDDGRLLRRDTLLNETLGVWANTTYEWDRFGRLQGVRDGPCTPAGLGVMGSEDCAVRTTYTYDALGRRVTKDVEKHLSAPVAFHLGEGMTATLTRIVWDGQREIMQAVATRHVWPASAFHLIDAADQWQWSVQEFVRGDGLDDLVAVHRSVYAVASGQYNEVRHWYLTDQLGSVTGLVDDLGLLAWFIRYDPYGTPHAIPASLLGAQDAERTGVLECGIFSPPDSTDPTDYEAWLLACLEIALYAGVVGERGPIRLLMAAPGV